MTTRIAAGLALLLALSGWSLYRQISTNGELQQKLQQRQIELRQEQERVETLRLDIEARDEAVRLLEVEVNDLRERKAKIRTVVRKVYVQPDVQEWAQTVPPAPVVRAVHAAIDCLHNPASGQDGDCRDFAAGGDDARL